jgi:UDP-glucose 4-epimerase
VSLYGFGKPTRDYVHVTDVARALVMCIGTTGTFNIATGRETSVQKIYELACLAVPESNRSEAILAALRPGELRASCLDISHAEAVLGWKPEIEVATGIPATVQSLLSD